MLKRKRVLRIVAEMAGLVLLHSIVFLAIASHIEKSSTMSALDHHALARLHEIMPTWVIVLSEAATKLAEPWFIGTLCATGSIVLILRRQTYPAIFLVAGVSANAIASKVLKNIFQRERPVGLASISLPESYAFPSGHASASLVFYGLCAYLFLRSTPRAYHAWGWGLTIALVLLIGASRVLLGVHYPSDVIAGFASGGVWLVVSIGSLEIIRERKDRLSFR